MESEKVKEIKKALEVYGNENKGITILRSGEIQSISYADILTYINELEKCSEKWQKLCADEVALNKTFRDKINELESENEKLNKIFTYDKSMRDRCFDFIKNTKEQALKQFAERLKEKLEEYRLENEYFIKDEPNGNLWRLNASVFCIEVTQDGGLVDETLNEFLKGENNE